MTGRVVACDPVRGATIHFVDSVAAKWGVHTVSGYREFVFSESWEPCLLSHVAYSHELGVVVVLRRRRSITSLSTVALDGVLVKHVMDIDTHFGTSWRSARYQGHVDVHRGVVYVSGNVCSIVLFDLATLKPLYAIRTGAAHSGVPIVSDSGLYLWRAGSEVVARTRDTCSQLWYATQYNLPTVDPAAAFTEYVLSPARRVQLTDVAVKLVDVHLVGANCGTLWAVLRQRVTCPFDGDPTGPGDYGFTAVKVCAERGTVLRSPAALTCVDDASGAYELPYSDYHVREDFDGTLRVRMVVAQKQHRWCLLASALRTHWLLACLLGANK